MSPRIAMGEMCQQMSDTLPHPGIPLCSLPVSRERVVLSDDLCHARKKILRKRLLIKEDTPDGHVEANAACDCADQVHGDLFDCRGIVRDACDLDGKVGSRQGRRWTGYLRLKECECGLDGLL